MVNIQNVLELLDMKAIDSYQRKYRWLSNFWPCIIEFEGLECSTLEHAFFVSAVKDHKLRKKIRDFQTPAEAKDFVEQNNLMTKDWTNKRQLRVMEELLMQKFGGKDPLLTRAFLATEGRDLIEGNNWGDTWWGVCDGIGHNKLGKVQMKVRSKLLKEKQKILRLVSKKYNNKDIAEALGITKRELYQKMLGYNIVNKEFWIQ